MDLAELPAGVDARAHWYYRAKALPLLAFARAALQGAAPVPLVDIGAGSGIFTDILLDALPGRFSDVWQVDAGYPADEESRDPRAVGAHHRRRVPPEEVRGGLILLMDVLEHAEDDEGLLRHAAASARGRCPVFITAPAFPSLWSAHDDFLGHKRRYRLGGLRALAERAGLEVLRAYYYFGLLLPAVWIARRLARGGPPRSDLRPLPTPLALALEGLCRLEMPWRSLNRLGGVTGVVEAVARGRP